MDFKASMNPLKLYVYFLGKESVTFIRFPKRYRYKKDQELPWEKLCKCTYIHTPFNVGFCGGSVVKNPLPMQEIQETWVRSLGQEDPLEKEMATHSSILAWGIPGKRSLEGYSQWGRKELDTT